MTEYVAYLRQSTQKQAQSGLGIEAQKELVERYLKQADGKLTCEPFIETESGKRSDRAELAKAMDVCRRTGSVLLIARLDRLSRDLLFVATMLRSDVKFVCADNPHATELTLGIMAVMAQHEARMCSDRTKAALKAAKARGVKLGNPNGRPFQAAEIARGRAAVKSGADDRAKALMPVLHELRATGVTTLAGLAAGLTERGVKTARGGSWTPMQVKRIMARAA